MRNKKTRNLRQLKLIPKDQKKKIIIIITDRFEIKLDIGKDKEIINTTMKEEKTKRENYIK